MRKKMRTTMMVVTMGRIVWDLTSGRSGNGSGFGGARAALVDVSRRLE